MLLKTPELLDCENVAFLGNFMTKSKSFSIHSVFKYLHHQQFSSKHAVNIRYIAEPFLGAVI